MCGCGAYKRKILATCPQVTEQSTTTTVETRIDTIITDADSALYKALIQCQNGKPVVVGEWADNGGDLSIFRLLQPEYTQGADSTKIKLVVKSHLPTKSIATPVTVTTTGTTYTKEAKQACPPCRHWPWYYWFIIGYCIKWFGPKIVYAIKWALSFIPGLQFLKAKSK